MSASRESEAGQDAEAKPQNAGPRRRGLGPFSGGQLTLIIVAVVVAVGFPIGAFATLSFSNVSITDPHGVNRAFVNRDGQLETHVQGAVSSGIPSHSFTWSGVTATSNNGIKLRVRCSTVPCRIAVTDVVMSQESTANGRLVAVLNFNQVGSDGTCTSLGARIKDVLPWEYVPAQQTTTINFTTPVVAAANSVCLFLITGFTPGMTFSYTVNGFWES